MRVLALDATPNGQGGEGQSVVDALRDLGCEVAEARADLRDLSTSIEHAPPDLIVVTALHQLQGARLCRVALGQRPTLVDVPTLLVTNVEALPSLESSWGFHDFILAPVIAVELYARMRQLDWRTASFGSDEIIKIEDLVIDLGGYEVRIAGRLVEFPHKEFELLRFLAQNRGRVYSRDQLLSKVWGDDYEGGTRTVDIHVRRVRAKLGTRLAGYLSTVRNVGYKMR